MGRPEVFTRTRTPSAWRLSGAFALGSAAAVSGFVFGILGTGEFVPALPHTETMDSMSRYGARIRLGAP